MDHTADIDILIARALAGECSEAEQAQLASWMAEKPENERYFRDMERLWQQSEPIVVAPDVEAALRKTKARIQAGQPLRVSSRRIWMAAAAAVVLLLTAWWFMQTGRVEAPQELAAGTATLRDTLHDGSVVSLRPHSTLSAVYEPRARRMRMRGEAYFEVKSDSTRPFVVEVQSVTVTVMGTKFNINEEEQPGVITIAVTEGKVRVARNGAEQILLAGDELSIDTRKNMTTRRKLDEAKNTVAWADLNFAFDDTPLSEVLPQLEKAYQTEIRLVNPELGKCRLHTRFKGERIDDILRVIAETFSLKIVVKNGRYHLDGEACND